MSRVSPSAASVHWCRRRQDTSQKSGEQVENLAASGEYHWFLPPNFIKYAGPLTAMDLPVDAQSCRFVCSKAGIYQCRLPDVEGQWVDAERHVFGRCLRGAVL